MMHRWARARRQGGECHEARCKASLPSFLSLAFAAPVPAQQPAPAPTLYKRLGGYDSMAAVTDDFLRRLTSDPAFTRFFSGHSTDSLKKIRQLVVDQLCAATGGPCVYIGRDMKATHAGLGITEKDWDTRSSI
jgi:hemoglobin